ncbi:hypothetical protein [Lysobacter sp. Root690]|uniref:hypothetical protein n=1 Tax=Lysobacter sp. Root690 TaxID=1736588 RepID=UPI000ACBBC94|nr:hypothetical protein [Lysobacter sp. Root690]
MQDLAQRVSIATQVLCTLIGHDRCRSMNRGRLIDINHAFKVADAVLLVSTRMPPTYDYDPPSNTGTRPEPDCPKPSASEKSPAPSEASSPPEPPPDRRGPRRFSR